MTGKKKSEILTVVDEDAAVVVAPKENNEFRRPPSATDPAANLDGIGEPRRLVAAKSKLAAVIGLREELT